MPAKRDRRALKARGLTLKRAIEQLGATSAEEARRNARQLLYRHSGITKEAANSLGIAKCQLWGYLQLLGLSEEAEQARSRARQRFRL